MSPIQRPWLQILRTGRIALTPEFDPGPLGQRFQRECVIRLPGFSPHETFQAIRKDVERSAFSEYEGKFYTERQVSDEALVARLRFLVNNQELFRWVERVSGCDPIGYFDGRVYEMLPGRHFDDWHSDCTGSRMVAMSVNLSASEFEGGVFQIRRVQTKELISEAPNTGAGDAILFRISLELEHQVTPIEGSRPKTALAGWFCREPRFHELFEKVTIEE